MIQNLLNQFLFFASLAHTCPTSAPCAQAAAQAQALPAASEKPATAGQKVRGLLHFLGARIFEAAFPLCWFTSVFVRPLEWAKATKSRHGWKGRKRFLV